MTTLSGSIAITRITANQGMILRELRLRSLAESPEAFGQPLADARGKPAAEWHQSARQSAQGNSRTWLLATRDQEIVGIVQGRRRRPATLLLFSMWIDPGMRRLGLGRELVSALERWATDWEAIDTILWVYGGNASAIRFYRELGFEVIPSGEDVEAGAKFGALAMQRIIPSR